MLTLAVRWLINLELIMFYLDSSICPVARLLLQYWQIFV